MKKSMCVVFLFIFISLFSLYAAPNTATAERYMTSANEQYGLQNYSKAYTYMSYVLEQYDEKTIDLHTKLLGELIFFDYLCEIEKKEDLTAFKEYQDSVDSFPYIVSDRIQKKLDYLVPIFQKKELEENQKEKISQTQAELKPSMNEETAILYSELFTQIENLEQLIIQLKNIIQEYGYYGIKPADIELLVKLYSLSETNQNAVKSLLDILYEQEQNAK